MEIRNTILDDLCTEIGFTATSILSAWFGGRRLWIPPTPTEKHVVNRLIGESAFRRLSAAFGGTIIHIPRNAAYSRFVRWRLVGDMLANGRPMAEIVERTKLSSRHIYAIRRFLEHSGELPMILRSKKTDADRPQDAC